MPPLLGRAAANLLFSVNSRVKKRSGVEVLPLTLDHLEEIDAPGQLGDFSFAGLRDGKVIAVSGIIEQWTGLGYAWFYAPDPELRDWPVITRLVRLGIEKARDRFRRLEIAVYDGHEAGHRWAVKLGFHLVAVCPKRMPDGSTGRLYAMVFEDG